MFLNGSLLFKTCLNVFLVNVNQIIILIETDRLGLRNCNFNYNSECLIILISILFILIVLH